MVVAVSIFELHIPAGRSLKEKRRVIKALTEKIHRRFRVSIAETDYHDLHQRAQFAIAAVHRSRVDLERLLDRIRTQVEEAPGALLISWERHFVEGSP
jgi:uncharacterized protein YlxP (DUF503 family)